MNDSRPEKGKHGGARPGAGRPPRELDAATWAPVFVAHYRHTGSAQLASEVAGVSVPTVRKYRLNHPAFARSIKQARRYFAESMEYELVKQARGESKGSFLATVSRLKATRRRMLERYSEKVADTRVLNLQVNAFGAPAAEAATALLERLVGRLGADEIQAMRGEIVDADVLPPALPAPSDTKEETP